MALGKVGGNQLETTLNIDSGTLYVDGTNNRVGIGTTSPQNLVQIEGSSGTAPSQLRLGVTSNGQYYDIGRDYTDGLMTFYSGQAVPYTGYKFSVNAGSEKIRIDNDGLKFNGDTAAANALDDYEQGTWTANINFGSNTGSSTGATYAESTGNYVKIGNLVHVQCRISLTNKGSSTGNANITGIPFSSNGSGTPIIPFACWYTSFTNVTRGQVVIGRIDNNSSGIELRFLDGNNEAVLNNTHLANNSNVAISGTYYTTA